MRVITQADCFITGGRAGAEGRTRLLRLTSFISIFKGRCRCPAGYRDREDGDECDDEDVGGDLVLLHISECLLWL